MSKSQASFHSMCSVLLVVVCLTGCKRAAEPDGTQQAITVTHIADRKVVLEILTEGTKTLSLYVGEKKWGSNPVGNSKKALATLEVSNQIQMEDGSLGYGIIYTKSIGRGVGKQFLAVTEKNGDLPYGEVTIRHADAIIETLDSMTFADIERPDGSFVPISLRLE